VAQPSVVCDTSVLLYLGRIDHLFLLPRLFAEVAIPVDVARELDAGRSVRADTVDVRQKPLPCLPTAWARVNAPYWLGRCLTEAGGVVWMMLRHAAWRINWA